MAGSVFKRCGYRDAAGKPLGSACPKLKKFDHGSWYHKAELAAGPDGKRRRVRRGGFATRRDAHQALTDLLDRVNKRTHLSTSSETVSDYLTRWLGGKSALRPTTRRSYEAHLRLYLIPGLGQHRLGDLSVEDVEELYAGLRQLGRTSKESPVVTRLRNARQSGIGVQRLTDASIRRVHATLMSALNTAAKRRLIPFNPAAFVELASGKRPKAVQWTDERVADWRRTGKRPKVAVWTPEQTGAFLDHAVSDRLYALYHLLTLRGLRRGEAVGLAWSEVDLAGGNLLVSEQIVQLGYRTETGPPKSDSSRLVALDEGTVAVLRGHSLRQSEERLAWGATWAESGLVFTRENGAALHPEYVTRHFERLARDADLPPIRLHDLRHGAATLALAGGADLKTVSEMLGHSTITITADTYATVLSDVARRAAESAARLVPRAQPTDRRQPGPISAPSGLEKDSGPSPVRTKGQVRRGAPRGT